uniref:Uncharacterized protein n=1 Tax=Panagrolaimus sp. JU765 TaxID=591449 RepID=A0AC34QY57_9BILA
MSEQRLSGQTNVCVETDNIEEAKNVLFAKRTCTVNNQTFLEFPNRHSLLMCDGVATDRVSSRHRMELMEDTDDTVHVFFINTTPYLLDVKWHRSDGLIVKYGSMNAKSYIGIRTFAGHKWSFRTKLGEFMLPSTSSPDDGADEQYFVAPDPQVRNRFYVYIFNRVYSLLYCSIRQVFKTHGNACRNLNLPEYLMKEINAFASKVEAYQAT